MKTPTYARFRATYRRRRHNKRRNYNPWMDFTIYPNQHNRTPLDIQVKAGALLHHIYDTTSTFLTIEIPELRKMWRYGKGQTWLACFRRSYPEQPWQYFGLATSYNPQQKTTSFTYPEALAIRQAAKKLAKTSTPHKRVVVHVIVNDEQAELVFNLVPNRWGRGQRWSFGFKKIPDSWYIKHLMEAGLAKTDYNTFKLGNP